MPYEMTKAQRRYLKKKYAKEKEEEKCCDCMGECDTVTCTGFIRGCTCDIKRLSYYTNIEEGKHDQPD